MPSNDLVGPRGQLLGSINDRLQGVRLASERDGVGVRVEVTEKRSRFDAADALRRADVRVNERSEAALSCDFLLLVGALHLHPRLDPLIEMLEHIAEVARSKGGIVIHSELLSKFLT